MINLQQQDAQGQPAEARVTYKPDELTAILSLSRSMVYSLIHAGTIRSIRVGRRFIVPADAVADFLAQPAYRADA